MSHSKSKNSKSKNSKADFGGFTFPEKFMLSILSGKTLAELEGYSEEHVKSLYVAGIDLYNAGRYREAHRVLHEAFRLNHLERRYCFAVAACLHKLKSYTRAANIYTSYCAMDTKADNSDAYFYIAECLFASGQSLDDAKEYYREAIQMWGDRKDRDDFKKIAEAKIELLNRPKEEETTKAESAE